MCIYIHTLICIYTTKLYLLEKVKFSHHHSKLENNVISKIGSENFSCRVFSSFKLLKESPELYLFCNKCIWEGSNDSISHGVVQSPSQELLQ